VDIFYCSLEVVVGTRKSDNIFVYATKIPLVLTC
jgi:hypothetical protein